MVPFPDNDSGVLCWALIDFIILNIFLEHIPHACSLCSFVKRVREFVFREHGKLPSNAGLDTEKMDW